MAAIVRSSPRASAGLSRLAASFCPACAAGADHRVRLVDEQDDRRRRPLHLLDEPLEPVLELALHAGARLQQRRGRACARRRSGAAAARRPAATRRANPSTTAVLPTPASPTRIGLFWRRRVRMSTTWRISKSRPSTGSISPCRALLRQVDACTGRAWRSCALPGRAAPAGARASAVRRRASRFLLRRLGDDARELLRGAGRRGSCRARGWSRDHARSAGRRGPGARAACGRCGLRRAP